MMHRVHIFLLPASVATKAAASLFILRSVGFLSRTKVHKQLSLVAAVACLATPIGIQSSVCKDASSANENQLIDGPHAKKSL